MERLLLRVEEASDLCALGRSKLYELIRANELPGVVRIGKSVRISRVALEAWINERAAVATSDNGSEEDTDEPRPRSRRV